MEDSIISSYSAVLVALLIQNDSVCISNVTLEYNTCMSASARNLLSM